MARLSYGEQIQREYRKAAKRKDRAAMRYWIEAGSKSACVSFERFKGSWAGVRWMELHDKIMAALDTIGRGVFSMASIGIVEYEVSKLVGQRVTYQQITSAIEVRRY